MSDRRPLTLLTSAMWAVPVSALLVACSPSGTPGSAEPPDSPPTAAEAKAFMDALEAEREQLREVSARTSWLSQTHITYDTKLLAAEAGKQFTLATIDAASKSTRFSELELDPVLQRKFDRLRLVSTQPPPNDEELAAEAAALDQDL